MPGNFSSGSFSGSIGGFSVDSAPVVSTLSVESYGSKRKRQVRGPYSDPAIFDAYVKRILAERAAPRVDPAKAALQENLLHEVEARRAQEIVTLDTLASENATLRALIEVENNKKDLRALKARHTQLGEQLVMLERQEAERDEIALMRVFNEFMED